MTAEVIKGLTSQESVTNGDLNPQTDTESPTIRRPTLTSKRTLNIDRQFPGFGRIKMVSGTTDRELFRHINHVLTTLYQTRQYHVIRAMVERRIRPIDLADLKYDRYNEPVSECPVQTFLYVMRSGFSGNLKIGIAQDVKTRLCSMRCSTWDEIELLGYSPSSRDEEREVHRQLRAERIRGEWFTPSPITYKWVHKFLKTAIKPCLTDGGVERALDAWEKRRVRRLRTALRQASRG